jgi:hypothetical protein
LILPGECIGDVDGQRGLADTALLIQKSNNHPSPLKCDFAELRFHD